MDDREAGEVTTRLSVLEGEVREVKRNVETLDGRVGDLKTLVIVTIAVGLVNVGGTFGPSLLRALQPASSVQNQTSEDLSRTSRLANRIVLEELTPIKGVVVTTMPPSGEGYATVSLFIQNNLTTWAVQVRGSNASSIDEAVTRATAPDSRVEGVRLSEIAGVVPPPPFVDAQRSFLVRGDVAVCLDNLKGTFLDPVATKTLSGPPISNTREYFDLVTKHEMNVKQPGHDSRSKPKPR